MKCSTCGKTIQNAYYLDGKVYGYNCYKMALALKYAAIEEVKNDDWTKKSIAAIETFRNKTFKDQWNKDFQTSVLNQWDSCNKLTGKQYDCIVKKFDKIEFLNYEFLYLDLLKDTEKIEEVERHLFYKIEGSQDLLKIFKSDERFLNIVSNHFKTSKKRGKRHFIIEFKDIDDEESIIQIAKEAALEGLKEDEYVEIIEIIEV